MIYITCYFSVIPGTAIDGGLMPAIQATPYWNKRVCTELSVLVTSSDILGKLMLDNRCDLIN